MSQERKWWEGVPRIQAAEGLGEEGLEMCWKLGLSGWALKPSLGLRANAKNMGDLEVIAP